MVRRIAIALLLLAAALAPAAAAEAMHGWVPAVPAALPLILVPVASSAFNWMRSYTPEGRRVVDQIEGFRHYLGVAEEDRLNALNPPEKTPERLRSFCLTPSRSMSKTPGPDALPACWRR